MSTSKKIKKNSNAVTESKESFADSEKIVLSYKDIARFLTFMEGCRLYPLSLKILGAENRDFLMEKAVSAYKQYGCIVDKFIIEKGGEK